MAEAGPSRGVASAGPCGRAGAMIGTVLCYVLLPAARLLRALRGNAAPGGRGAALWRRRGLPAAAPRCRGLPLGRGAGVGELGAASSGAFPALSRPAGPGLAARRCCWPPGVTAPRGGCRGTSAKKPCGGEGSCWSAAGSSVCV